MRNLTILLVLVALIACTRAAEKETASSGGATEAKPALVLPFIADDYAAALAEAKTRKVPLFIETWAPW